MSSVVDYKAVSAVLNSLLAQVSEMASKGKGGQEVEPVGDLAQTSSTPEKVASPLKTKADPNLVVDLDDETNSGEEEAGNGDDVVFLGKFPNFSGFTLDDEAALFPKIDSDSAKLFAMMKLLSKKQRLAVMNAVASKGGEITLHKEYPKVVLRHLKQHRPPPLLELSPMASSRYHAYLAWPEDVKVELSEEQLAKYRVVFEDGWKRETVLLSQGRRQQKTYEAVVHYFAPNRELMETVEEVEQYLSEVGSQLTVDNFSFERVRISENPDEEIVREMFPLKAVVAAPPGNSKMEVD